MHTSEQLVIMEEYSNSIDNDVKDFIEDVINGNDRINFITVAFLSDKAAKRIKELTGKDVEGSRVVLDINAIKHIINRHGKEGKQDTSMKNIEDIARMGYVISNYDDIVYEGITTTGYLDENGEASPMIKMSKRIDGTYYIIETVNSSKRKKNYIVSAYIKKAEK